MKRIIFDDRLVFRPPYAMTACTFRPEQVHPTAFLARGAVVVGDVAIGEESSVWFNAVVRADCEAVRIGRRTNVQDNCVLHADPGFPCTLGDGATVGHGAIVHGATIGDNVTIGMGAVVMNGAVVGADSVVGAGALLTEGTIVPVGSLVLGLPAKVVRSATAEEIDRNRRAAAHYVAAARAFREAEAKQPADG